MKISGAGTSDDSIYDIPSHLSCKGASECISSSEDSVSAPSEAADSDDCGVSCFELEESDLGEFLMETFEEVLDAFGTPQMPHLSI